MKLFWALTLVLVLELVGDSGAATDPRALALVKLMIDILYKSPANNDFIYMVEHRMMDDGIANIIEGMAPKLASPRACDEFKKTNPGSLSVGPVQRRTVDSASALQKSVLNILDSAEGKSIMQQGVSGSIKDIPPPRYSSGGFNFKGVLGKRLIAVDSSMQRDVLNILNSNEGKSAINDKVSGKILDIPAPRFNSAGFRLGKRASTSQHNIAQGQHAGFATKATALLARVRNIAVNTSSLRLFETALDDGTVRAAMYNVCRCNDMATTIRNLYNMKG